MKAKQAPARPGEENEMEDYLDELRLIETVLEAQFIGVVRACYPLHVAYAALDAAEADLTDSHFRRPGSRPELETRAERDEAQARFEALLVEYPRARAARAARDAVTVLANQVEYDITGGTT